MRMISTKTAIKSGLYDSSHPNYNVYWYKMKDRKYYAILTKEGQPIAHLHALYVPPMSFKA